MYREEAAVAEVLKYDDLRVDYYRGCAPLELSLTWEDPPPEALRFMKDELSSALGALYGVDSIGGEKVVAPDDEPRRRFGHLFRELRFAGMRLWLDDSPGRATAEGPLRIQFIVGRGSPFTRRPHSALDYRPPAPEAIRLVAALT